MNKRDEAILNLADPDDEIFQLHASARTKWWLEALDFLNLGIHDMILNRKAASSRWYLVGSGKRWKLCALNRKDEPTWTDATRALSDTTDLKKFQLDGIVYRLQRRIR